MPEFNDQIHAWISEAMRKRSAAIEAALRMAAEDGMHGVSVYSWNVDTTIYADARVDPDVPYGHVYEYPYGESP